MANISSVYDNYHENFLAALPFCRLNSNCFDAAMYELAHGSLHYDTERLDSLLFNPITDQSCFGSLLDSLGAVHMSRASPANRADLSHENLYFLKT